MMLLFSGSTAISAILPEVSAGPTLLHFIDERLKPSSWAGSDWECREKAMINSKADRCLIRLCDLVFRPCKSAQQIDKSSSKLH
jgi:hypothetical protein